MRPRHAVLSLLALAGLVPVLAGCGGAAEAEGTEATTPVVSLSGIATLDLPDTTVGTLPQRRPATAVVVGDSLTLSATDEIEAAVAPTGVDLLAVDAVEGRRTAKNVDGRPSGVSAVTDLRELDPELWVVALGTNDVGGQEDRDAFRDDVEALLAKLPADAPVIWLDVWIEDRIEGATIANEVLREVAAGRHDMTVVNWFQFGDDPGLIVGDGVHLTQEGQLKFAEQIADEIRARFG